MHTMHTMHTMHIEYTVYIWKEEDQFVAQALPLDILSSGETPEKARLAVDEAVDLFLITAKEMGTLDQVLEEAGYQSSQGKWINPSWVAIERHSVVVGI